MGLMNYGLDDHLRIILHVGNIIACLDHVFFLYCIHTRCHRRNYYFMVI